MRPMHRAVLRMIMKRQTGFTLVELMVTLAIAAIVLTIGIPAFQEAIRSNRLATITNDFVSTLMLARSEAVKRSTKVSVCKSTNGTSCSTAASGYETGWIVFVDVSNTGANKGTIDGNDQVIRVFEGSTSGVTLRGDANTVNFLTYAADGSVDGVNNTTMTVCKTPKARTITLNKAGRPYVLETTCS